MLRNALTDTQCRKATCPTDRVHLRLQDGEGLYLQVSRASKRWFWKFYPEGKEKQLSLGSYPDMPLKAAREARDAVRKEWKAGIDPIQKRKSDKLARTVNNATTFEAVAREFHQAQAGGWSETHAAQWLRCTEKDLFPWLGTLPLADVSLPHLLQVVGKVQARGAAYSARTLIEYAGQVFRYGMQTGRCTNNPASEARGAVKAPAERNVGAVLDPVQAGALLRSIDGYKGGPVTRTALALSALVFQRPGNIREMEWTEIDTDAALWTIPSAKMKRTKEQKINGRPHFVPLAPQALRLLADLRPLTGHGRYVFPSLLTGERCMSENTVRGALRRMGYGNDEMTAHGFRAMARTLITERLPSVNVEVIEAQLAHGKRGPLGMAYDRSEYMDQRRIMMTTWADYLDKLRAGGEVLAFRAA
jgi:integrase